jgi:hypothetical protein
MTCYGDSYTFLYVVNIRSSQETCLWASMAYYRHSLVIFHIILDVQLLWGCIYC